MKNNKGFTIIELAVSFCLVAAVSITLLQLVLTLKEVYLSGDVKTTLLNKQGIMVKKIYDDLNNKDLNSITSCGVSCLNFTYGDGTITKLLVDPGNKTVTYSDYTIKLDNSSYFGTLDLSYKKPTSPLGKIDSVFRIDIPIYSKLLDEDVGIHIVKIYNSNTTTINNEINLVDLTSSNCLTSGNCLIIGGLNANFSILNNEDGTLNNIFTRVYHQESGNYFSDYNSVLKNNNSKTYSILGSLDAFKNKSSVSAIIDAEKNKLVEAKLNQKNIQNGSIGDLTSKELEEIEKLINITKEQYQNGYYSLLLNYNNVALSSGNYSWWYQTSNFAKKESLSGFTVSYGDLGVDGEIGSDDVFHGITGIAYNKTDSSFFTAGYNSTLGVISGNLTNYNGNISSIDLYAEAREYLCRYSLSDVTYNGQSLKTYKYSDQFDCSKMPTELKY